jgi:hypothetical protein
MSPALVKKYLEAARRVAEHVVFKPDGLAFAPHPMVAETDRDKYAVRQVVEFYKRQPTDLADYFAARVAAPAPGRARQASRHAGRRGGRGEGQPGVPGDDLGGADGEPRRGRPRSRRCVRCGRSCRRRPTVGRWTPCGPGASGCRDFVASVRGQLVPEVPNLTAPGVHNGSQPLVMWKNRAMATNRRRYAGGARKVKLPQQGLSPDSPAARAMAVPGRPGRGRAVRGDVPPVLLRLPRRLRSSPSGPAFT